MWCVTAKSIGTGVTALQDSPMVASTVCMMGPGMASVGVVMTVTSISVGSGLWP